MLFDAGLYGALTAGVLLLASLSGVVLTADEPDPVIGPPAFNDPAGSVDEQYAIFQQLARIIDRVAGRRGHRDVVVRV